MIRQIRGTVLETTAQSALIEVAGFGLQVFMTDAPTLTVGAEAVLKTYLCIKQDGVDLYGFQSDEDRTFFELLLTVSGVGPKTALSIFQRSTRDSLSRAIGTRDVTYLTRVVGLGKKAAEKLVVELSEKVGVGEAEHPGEDSDVFDTLVALGYTEREARSALARVPLHIHGRDERLKAALSSS